MSTRAAALQPGPFIARSRANEARSPASLPTTSSYMTSSLGRAEAPQAVLLPICSCSSCLSSYLGLHYKELLYGALKGSSHSLLFLLLAACFVKADSCIQHRTFLCARARYPLMIPCLFSFLFVCVFLLPPLLATCISESPALLFDACLSVFFLDAVSHSPPARLISHFL